MAAAAARGRPGTAGLAGRADPAAGAGAGRQAAHRVLARHRRVRGGHRDHHLALPRGGGAARHPAQRQGAGGLPGQRHPVPLLRAHRRLGDLAVGRAHRHLDLRLRCLPADPHRQPVADHLRHRRLRGALPARARRQRHRRRHGGVLLQRRRPLERLPPAGRLGHGHRPGGGHPGGLLLRRPRLDHPVRGGRRHDQHLRRARPRGRAGRQRAHLLPARRLRRPDPRPARGLRRRRLGRRREPRPGPRARLADHRPRRAGAAARRCPDGPARVEPRPRRAVRRPHPGPDPRRRPAGAGRRGRPPPHGRRAVHPAARRAARHGRHDPRRGGQPRRHHLDHRRPRRARPPADRPRRPGRLPGRRLGAHPHRRRRPPRPRWRPTSSCSSTRSSPAATGSRSPS